MTQVTRTVCDNCGKDIDDFRIADIRLQWVIRETNESYGRSRQLFLNACSLDCAIVVLTAFWEKAGA